MIFIYNCYAGTHTSSLASAIHLKKLPADRMPSKKEIIETDYFDKLTPKDIGKIIYRGTDDEGNKVFTMGRGSSKLIVPCMANLINLLANGYGLKEKIVFSNMSPAVTLSMSIGGIISRRFGFKAMGLPLILIGVREAYEKIVNIVENTKKADKASPNCVVILSNKKF